MGGIFSSNRVRPVEARPLTAREQLLLKLTKVKPFPVELEHGGHQLRTASIVENNNRR